MQEHGNARAAERMIAKFLTQPAARQPFLHHAQHVAPRNGLDGEPV